MELLAITHSSSERRIIFVFQLLKFSHVLVGYFITCMGAHFPAVELDNTIRFSTLSRMSGFLWHSSKWACRFDCFLQYMSGIEALACSLDTDLNYDPTVPFFEPLGFWVYSQRHILCNSSSALFWTRGPLLNFPVKWVSFSDP